MTFTIAWSTLCVTIFRRGKTLFSSRNKKKLQVIVGCHRQVQEQLIRAFSITFHVLNDGEVSVDQNIKFAECHAEANLTIWEIASSSDTKDFRNVTNDTDMFLRLLLVFRKFKENILVSAFRLISLKTLGSPFCVKNVYTIHKILYKNYSWHRTLFTSGCNQSRL
jgi:hypothetical protein